MRPKPVRIAQADSQEEDAPVDVEEVREEPPPPPPPEETQPMPVTKSGGSPEPPPPPPPPPEEAAPPPAQKQPEEKPARSTDSTAGSEARVEVSSALKNMTWVGFQQTAEASRVFIKTNEPVKYRVVEEGDDLVVLELENTRIPLRNNRRFLDTHFFNTAVTMVTPKEIEGVSHNVRVEIQLRNKTPYTAGQEDNVVYVRFERPHQ
jgi:hypothetical protein